MGFNSGFKGLIQPERSVMWAACWQNDWKICRSIPDRCNSCQCFKATRRTLGSTKSPIPYVPGALYLAVSGRDLKFTSSSTKVKNEWRYTATPLGPHGVHAIKLLLVLFKS